MLVKKSVCKGSAFSRNAQVDFKINCLIMLKRHEKANSRERESFLFARLALL